MFWPFLYNRKSGRKYGVIECDPLVRKGLEKTVGDRLSFDLLVRLSFTQNQQKEICENLSELLYLRGFDLGATCK